MRRFREKWQLSEEDPNGHYAFVTEYRQRALQPFRKVIRSAIGWRRGARLEQHALLPVEVGVNRFLFPERLAGREQDPLTLTLSPSGGEGIGLLQRVCQLVPQVDHVVG